MIEVPKIKFFSFLVIMLFVLLHSHFYSQDNSKKIAHGNQQWIQYYSRLKLNNKYTLLGDGSFRWKNQFNDYSLALLRTGLSYNITENSSVASGVCSTLSFAYNNVSKFELRGWQELLFLKRSSKCNLSNRFRLEERYFKKVTANEFKDGYNFNYRFRYRLFATIPLHSDSLKNRVFSLNVGDEIFLNFGKEIIYNTYDSNRILVGVNYQLNKNQTVTLNYMYQFSQGTTKYAYDENDVIWLSFTQSLSLKKKK